MNEVRVFQMDAFTHTPFGGNPAGVIPNADGLTDEQMQRIAREMNCSETAFVLSTDTQGADVRVRFFTPVAEVDLCGHATISTFVALANEQRFGSKRPYTIVQETRAGKLPVMISEDGEGRIQVLMTMAAPRIRECEFDPRAVADLPVGLGYTGLWDLFVPIRKVEAFARMQPDMVALAEMNRRLGVASTHCYSVDTHTPEAQLHARDFSPSLGIPEDPATGTANGALGAFLVHHGVFVPQREKVRLKVEQGFEIGRPSLICVEVDGEPNSPRTVRVGGTAVQVMQGTMMF